MIKLNQRIEAAGITLELSACVSDEALQVASGASAPGQQHEGSQFAMRAVDPLRLSAAMQPGLSLGLQGLRENLVDQALASLELEVSAAFEALAAQRGRAP